MSKINWKRVDWASTLFLSLTPPLAVILTIYYFQTETFNYWMIPIFIFFYYAMGMSITGGYHRLIAHRSYQANALVRFAYLFFGAGAFQNSARVWAIDHRIHHRYVDTDQDPYSINKGFWFAHLLWMFDAKDMRESPQARAYARDLDKDPLIVFQHKYYYSIAIFSCFIFPMFIGWLAGSALGGLVFGGLLRMVLVHHFTFFINSLCHFWGRRPYTDTNTARDNALAAIFTYGEGYHNFHHIFHADYRNGIRWYHYDPTKWFIKFLAYIRMVRDLKVTPEYEIFKAKMMMKEKYLREKKVAHIGHAEKILENFKQKAEDAHARWSQLKAEYESAKHNFNVQNEERIRILKRDINLAKLEFRVACQQWRICLKPV